MKKTVKKSTKKAAPISTEKNIVMVLDETGSMMVRLTETVRGFDEYIDTAKKEHPGARFTLTRFNSDKIETTLDSIPIKNVPSLSDYKPNNMTPLYDAIGRTMSRVEKLSGKVIFVVITDGEENYSKEFSREKIFDKIKEFEKKGWLFVYIGVDVDAWGAASKLGIGAASTVTSPNMRSSYVYTACATADYFAGKSVNMSDYDKKAGDPVK